MHIGRSNLLQHLERSSLQAKPQMNGENMHTTLTPGPSKCHGVQGPEAWHIILAAIFTAGLLSVATTAGAQGSSMVRDLPHALLCEKEGVTVIGYLARINSDGSAVYMTPSNIVVEVSSEGMVDNRADGSCAGKSLSELRGSGQTFEFAHETD